MTQATFFYDALNSPLGPLWMVSTREGLCFLLWKEKEADFLAEIKTRTGSLPSYDPGKLKRWRRLLTRYFLGERIRFGEPISFRVGTPFQKKIWKKMSEIPYGEARSYQWIADQLQMGRAARAVGNACGKNPLPIVIPCHRVVRQDGSLGGYTGGVAVKKKLLEIEISHQDKREGVWPISMK
ncbi:MAG TPA: methylated-DNA--[protein]-cysteine S-methyltransferase [Candidatus Manganitrophaceae bacterium]|nr:methylated-DNA--[protein]-cysteine S-methyltransferase [Candidatus Manganitrophaceae bacterium]